MKPKHDDPLTKTFTFCYIFLQFVTFRMCIFFLHLLILLKFVVFSFNKEQIEVERTLAFMKNEPHIPHNNSGFFFYCTSKL